MNSNLWMHKNTEMCSYWQRQQFREATDSGFGAHPYSFMKPAQIEKAEQVREQEDERDPPCGVCVACTASDDDDNPTGEG